MLGGNTEHVANTRLSGNTIQKPRGKPPMQVRRVQPAKKVLTKSLGSLCLSSRKPLSLYNSIIKGINSS